MNAIIQARMGLEVLRMHKYLKSESCYTTILLTTTGAVYSRKSEKKPTTSPIGSFRFNKKWLFYGTTTESTSDFKKRLLMDGWQVPRGYWEGPPEKRPARKYREKQQELDEQVPDIMSEWSTLRFKKSTKEPEPMKSKQHS